VREVPASISTYGKNVNVCFVFVVVFDVVFVVVVVVVVVVVDDDVVVVVDLIFINCMLFTLENRAPLLR